MWRLGLVLVFLPALFHSVNGTWNHWGHNSNGSRFTRDSCIRSSRAGLRRKWEFNASAAVQATPTVCGGRVFFPDNIGNIYAVNASTGRLIWRRSMSEYMPEEGTNSFSRTSLATNSDCQRLVFGTKPIRQPGATGAWLIAVHARNGSRIWRTRLSSHRYGQITQSPTIYKGNVYVGTASSEENQAGEAVCCVFRGFMCKVSLSTGAIAWRVPMTLDNRGDRNGWSGNAIWSPVPSIDPSRNIVVVTTGNNYKYPKSYADCLARTNGNHRQCNVAGNYVDAFVAINLDSGAVVWANSLNWDYYAWWWPTPTCRGWFGCWANGPDRDFAQGAVLARGRFIAGQKNGVVHALFAANGTVAWQRSVQGGTILWGSATDGDYVYVASTSGHVYSFDVRTGTMRWRRAVGGEVHGPVSVANDVVFVPVLTGRRVAWLRASDGTELGGYSLGTASFSGPAISGNSVYFGSGFKQTSGSFRVTALQSTSC